MQHNDKVKSSSSTAIEPISSTLSVEEPTTSLEISGIEPAEVTTVEEVVIRIVVAVVGAEAAAVVAVAVVAEEVVETSHITIIILNISTMGTTELIQH